MLESYIFRQISSKYLPKTKSSTFVPKTKSNSFRMVLWLVS